MYDTQLCFSLLHNGDGDDDNGDDDDGDDDGDDDDDAEPNVLGCRVDILGTNCDQCVCMVQCCFTSTETIRLIRDGEPRTDTSTFTQLLNSRRSCRQVVLLNVLRCQLTY